MLALLSVGAAVSQRRPPWIVGVYGRLTRTRRWGGLLGGGLLLLLFLSLQLLSSTLVHLAHDRLQQLPLTIEHYAQLFALTESGDRESEPLPVLVLYALLRFLVCLIPHEHNPKRATIRPINLRLKGCDCAMHTEMSSYLLIWHERRYT